MLRAISEEMANEGRVSEGGGSEGISGDSRGGFSWVAAGEISGAIG